jgi:hypothetical protein
VLDLSDLPADADAWESADRDEVGVALVEGVWLRVVVGSTTAQASYPLREWPPGWSPRSALDEDAEDDEGGES